MLIYSALHWPAEPNEDLWPFSLSHAVNIWNHLPNKTTGLSPVEIFSGIRVDNSTFLTRLRVWGCPSYVLNPTFQDGKKLPKWKPKSRQGQFLGFSSSHSSTIGLIRNLRTGYISPQYHVVYDDNFHTVPGAAFQDVDNMTSTSPFWQHLVTYGQDYYFEDLTPNEHRFIPTLSTDWDEEANKNQNQPLCPPSTLHRDQIEIIDPTINLPPPNPTFIPHENILPDLKNPDVHEPPSPPIPNQ